MTAMAVLFALIGFAAGWEARCLHQAAVRHRRERAWDEASEERF